MRLSDWRERLEAETDLEVLGAANLVRAQEEHRRDTVYVMYSSDDARPSDVTGQVRQEHSVGVDVVSAVTNYRDGRGSDAVDEVERVREQVLAALIGWAPPSAGGDEIQYRRGRLLGFSKRTVWWQDSFAVFEYRASAIRPG